MKFYKRFPGDITIKTGDLTLTEFGAYDRLLDHYYAKEQPIDPTRVYNVTRCQSAADRKAVDRVLAEYWTLTPSGWVQERADEMIADALPRIEAARANGKKGGRPRKEPAAEAAEQKPTGFFPETQIEPRAKTSQSQSISPTSKSVSKASPSHPPAGGLAAGFDEFWQAWPKGERKQDKAKCLDHWKRNGLHLLVATILADVRVKRGTTKWQEGYIEAPLVYLRGKRWEDGVQPDDGKPAEGVHEWHETRHGVEAKAESLGMPRWQETEQWHAYRARVMRAAGVEPRRVA